MEKYCVFVHNTGGYCKIYKRDLTQQAAIDLCEKLNQDEQLYGSGGWWFTTNCND